MSEASVKRVLQLVALRKVFEGIFERLGAPNGPNMEPKGLPKWSQNRCQDRSRAEVASREGSGGPRDAPSPLLETILVPFWCQIGSISESSKGVPGTSKSFQKHSKTTFRVTDRREATRRVIEKSVPVTAPAVWWTTCTCDAPRRCTAESSPGQNLQGRRF